ncbi:MAG: hypothetical protein AAFN81_00010 [Bacteroidota bacterium]
MKKQVVTIILMFSILQAGVSCSCSSYLLDLPIREMGWTQSRSAGVGSPSDLIFTGTLLEAKRVQEERLDFLYRKGAQDRYEMVFRLIKSYKGKQADTIRVRTNLGTDACGFTAPQNTDCLIFAGRNGNGFYYTYRSDCCKSISKANDEKRYNRYITFLESILNMTDGNYDFKQTRTYWEGGYSAQNDTLDLLSYQIKNGQFDGRWKITDRLGRVLEEGHYDQGKRVGTWKIVSFLKGDGGNSATEVEHLQYRDGQPWKSEVIIEEEAFNYSTGRSELVHRQRISKTYEYD